MDKDDRRSGGIRLLFAALFSLIAAVVWVSLETDLQLDSVVTVDYYDGKIYGIDSDDYKTSLFCVDPVTERGIYYIRDYSDEDYRQFSDIVVADDGTVFVLQEKAAEDNKKAWAVLVWDTKSNTLRHGADIEIPLSYARLESTSKIGNTIQMLFYTGKDEDTGDNVFSRYVLNGNEIELTGMIISDIDYHEIYMLDDRMVLVDAFGCVYYVKYADGVFDALKDEEGEIYDTLGTRFCVVGHTLYYLNYIETGYYKVDLDADDIKEERVSDSMELPKSFDFYSTNCIKYDENKTLVCAVSLDDGTSVVGYNGIQDKIIDKVKSTDVDKLKVFVAAYIICFICASAVALRVNIKAEYLKKRSIKLRLSVYALVLTAVICVMFELHMQDFLEEYVTWNAINTCSAMAKIKEYDLDKDALENILSEEIVYESFDLDIWVTMQSEKSSEDASKAQSNMDFLVYYPVGDAIYSADQTLRYNTPVYLIVGRPMQNMVKTALETDTPQSGTFVYKGNKIVAVFVPATTQTGHRYVLEAYMSIDEIIASMQIMNRKMSMWVLLFGVLIVLGIYAAISYCLIPLGYLKEAVGRVAEGELGAQAKIVGHNEVASTAVSFNRMSETLMKLNGVVDSYRRLYEAFVPMKLCEQLSGKDDIEISLEPKSSYSGNAYIMAMRFDISQEDELVDLVRLQLDTCMSHTGTAASISGKQKIIFCESADSAVSSAVKLLEQLGPEHRAHIAVNRAYVTLSVLGCEARRSMTIGDDIDESLMEHMAKYMDASLYVSESVMRDLEKEVPGKYHSRYLGRLSIEGRETSQPLYEILDSEPQSVRELKLMTAENFNRGVRAYEAGDMFTARTEMIRVKMDYPKDRVSRGYILCCDKEDPPAVCRAEG